MGRERFRVEDTKPQELTKTRVAELGRCYEDYIYFVDRYCMIYDSAELAWIRFKLWDAQRKVLHDIHNNQLTVILKARQLGISWLSLSYALWTMVFRPISVVSIFSRRETEAVHMMGEERLRGMYNNLPLWMRGGHQATTDSSREWILATGSAGRAFPTSAGDGYVSTLAIVDEADLAPDLNQLLRSVKPTIDTGGKMILLSRSNKDEPNSEFKNIYRSAKKGDNPWTPVFLPWFSHPGRDKEWYERQKIDIHSRTGSLDDLWEQYPETDIQALAAKTLSKRIPPQWLEQVYLQREPVRTMKAPALPSLKVYATPVPGHRYVIGADSAEGNPTSDDSALTVLDVTSGEEVAVLAGKYEPAIFAGYISQVSAYYHFAAAMVERNNHGHSVIQWLEEHARRVKLLLGHDAETHKSDKKNRDRRKKMKAGWLTSTLGKTILYTACTEFIRMAATTDTKIIHTFETYLQLGSIESNSLSAPEGDHDDYADSFALAVVGRAQLLGKGHSAGFLVDTVKGWGQ